MPGHETNPPPPDQDQRDLIAHELDRNLLVEAAAGTGKTTSLVTRMVNLICEGKCGIDKIAAVTFTRKASAELRSRFQVALEKATREASGKARTRLAAAVEHVEQCYLGTIHSFCARLLRERPVEALVDANFRELDETEDLLLRRRAWDEHVANLFANDDPLLVELANVGLEIGQLRESFFKFADYPDVAEWPAPTVDPPDSTPTIEALQDYVRHMEKLAKSFPDDPGNDKLMPKLKQVARMVRQADLQKPAALLEVLELFDQGKPHIVQRNWPQGPKQAKAELERWNAFADAHALSYVQAMREVRYAPALAVIKSAVPVYKRLRREAGGLNFQDLLLGAVRLLRDKLKIREYFRRRFTHLLVDEFQDTDPIQAEVLLLLTADDPTQTDWRKCRPVPGALFVVGDPKQSIYRFRRADIVTYNDVRRLIQDTGGRLAALTANFRSTASLVDWVNQAFVDCFPETATEFAPARCPLQVGRAGDHNGALAGIYKLSIPGKNKDQVLEYEAGLVARKIRHALDTGCTVPRSGKEVDQGIKPAAKPGDFLIVTRNTTNLSRYAQQLQELGIPHEVTGGTMLNESEELRLLFMCLRAVIRPDDPVALVAALRSELFGISDPALLAFKEAGGQFSFRSKVPEAGLAAAAAFQDAFSRLSCYDRWLKTLPPAAAFEKVAADQGLPARACAQPGGEVRAGSLMKALQLVRTRAAAPELHALADLVEYLGQLVEQKEKHDSIPVRPHGEPVVRLMNLHKVKGLEAPVVFLADPSGEAEHPVELYIDRSSAPVKGYLAIYEPKHGHTKQRLLACPQDWEKLADKEKRFQAAENDRLLYVAATRAGTFLTIAQRESRENKNPWQPFEDYLKDQPALEDPGDQSRPTTAEVAVGLKDVTKAKAAIDERWEKLRQRTYDSKAIKEISLASSAPILQRGTAPEGEHGVEWGTVIHTLLETAMMQPQIDLCCLSRSLCREQDWPAMPIDAAVLTVKKVMGSAIWRRARESRRRLVEVPLQQLAPANDKSKGVPTVQRGVIDLIFLEPNGWVIVDYKTDDVAASAVAKLADYYRPQVQKYAKVWQELVGQPVHEVGLYFIRHDRYCEVPLL